MPETMQVEKTLAEATTKFVDVLRIKISTIANYEDEDFTFEITIPKNLSIDDVPETCHKECIKVEDEYDLFILPKVIYEQ
jgi:hypothetical protein